MKRIVFLTSFLFALVILFSCEKMDSGFSSRPDLKPNKMDSGFNSQPESVTLNEENGSSSELKSASLSVPFSEGCETAFARKTSVSRALCFTTLDLDLNGRPDFNRWGWSNGPIPAEHSTWYNLYAAAGQCDPEKGVLVGRMDVHYYNGTVNIVLSVKPGYTLDETHLYVGNDILPKLPNGKYTVAPGQYPYSHDLSGAKADYYTIENVTGNIYVIMHAVVCKVSPA